jgi:hypothetical protein
MDLLIPVFFFLTGFVAHTLKTRFRKVDDIMALPLVYKGLAVKMFLKHEAQKKDLTLEFLRQCYFCMNKLLTSHGH